MKKVQPIKFDEWVNEINKPFEKNDNSFFLSEFAKKTGLSRTTALNRVEALIRNGNLRKESIIYEGKRCNLYTIIK